MPIEHAVLGLLAHGPSHGYELRASFQEAIGPQWGELNIGRLYQVLDRLARDGFVSGSVVSQQRRPDKTVYRLTKDGRAELNDWLKEPIVRKTGYRDEFFLKLFIASRFGVESVRALVRTQREAYLGEVGGLEELRERHHDDPLVRLLVEAAILHTDANLRFLERVTAEADDLAARAVSSTAENLDGEQGDAARTRISGSQSRRGDAQGGDAPGKRVCAGAQAESSRRPDEAFP